MACSANRVAGQLSAPIRRQHVGPRDLVPIAFGEPIQSNEPSFGDTQGELHSLFEQDRSRWDRTLIAEGQRLLDLSATGPDLTEYHLQAAIAWVHATASRTEDTNWARIVSLYDMLLGIRPSPVVALNRAIAIAERDGPDEGLREIRSIPDLERHASYPFFPAAVGELEIRMGRLAAAREQFQKGLILARNPMERRFLEARLEACKA